MTYVDVWLENLKVSASIYRDCWAVLNSNERDKAQRFVRERDKQRYVVSHGKLRIILAEYLSLSPANIIFATHTHGKPFINPHQSTTLVFNLAHSGDLLLLGVGQGYDIGVDIEMWSNNIDYEAIRTFCFSHNENQYWEALSPAQKTAFFYTLWTRKESFIKAVGQGLSLDITQIDTDLTGMSRFTALPINYGLPEQWQLIDFKLGDGLSAAVTLSSKETVQINYCQLDN